MKTPTQRLAEIRSIIDGVANRCMACDGPVGNERDEITTAELRRIYLLTKPTRKQRVKYAKKLLGKRKTVRVGKYMLSLRP